jgi:hypothetical protein
LSQQRQDQPIIPPDLREKPRRPVNSNVEAVEKPVFKRKFDKEVAQQWSALFFIFMPFSRSNGKGSDFSWAGRLV